MLEEINRENPSENGEEFELKSLGATLEFVTQFMGRKYKSITEPLPLSTLKTIKRLYLKNRESRIQLFQYLKSPRDSGKPTMEWRLIGNAPRNETGVKVTNELLSHLSVEISESKIRQIETSLLTPSALLGCIHTETEEILAPIYASVGDNHGAVASAFRFMTAAIIGYIPRRFEIASSLDEMVYTYIRTLPFLHFAGEYERILELAKVERPVKAIIEQTEEFCARLSAQTGEEIHFDTPITSVENFPEFVEEHQSDIRKLVKTATGIFSEKRDLLDKINSANKVLNAYVFHELGKIPLHVKKISALDCVAAFCTIRHQQKQKTNYPVYWPGQTSSEESTSPLVQLDDSRSIEELYEEDYVPHGTNQLLYNRFCAFYEALSDRHDRHQAWVEFQVARLQKYADCFLSNDINHINSSVMNFNAYCRLHAIQAARLSDRV